MKAVDFIRKFGWNNAIDVVINCEKYHPVYKLPVDDLKKYTDAYELVQKFGGLDGAKDKYFSCVQNNESASHINEAITLVEEVGECDE